MSTITNLPVASGKGGGGGISAEKLNETLGIALETAMVDVARVDDVNNAVADLAKSSELNSLAKTSDLSSLADKATLDTINTNASDLNTRLTSTRAGYLDYLANSTYGLSALKTAISSSGGLTACVKNVQRGFIKYGTVTNGKIDNGGWTGSNPGTTQIQVYDCYYDVTISAVSNINKCFVVLYCKNTDDPCLPQLVNTTKLRIWAKYSNSSTAKLEGTVWEVVEFY